MRNLLAAVGMTMLLACGGDKITAPTPMTAVTFKVDAQTCSGTAILTLFIDGAPVGSESMSAGGSSKAYPTTASTHILGATVANVTNPRTWGPINVNLTNTSTYLQLLICA